MMEWMYDDDDDDDNSSQSFIPGKNLNVESHPMLQSIWFAYGSLARLLTS